MFFRTVLHGRELLVLLLLPRVSRPLHGVEPRRHRFGPRVQLRDARVIPRFHGLHLLPQSTQVFTRCNDNVPQVSPGVTITGRPLSTLSNP